MTKWLRASRATINVVSHFLIRFFFSGILCYRNDRASGKRHPSAKLASTTATEAPKYEFIWIYQKIIGIENHKDPLQHIHTHTTATEACSVELIVIRVHKRQSHSKQRYTHTHILHTQKQQSRTIGRSKNYLIQQQHQKNLIVLYRTYFPANHKIHAYKHIQNVHELYNSELKKTKTSTEQL